MNVQALCFHQIGHLKKPQDWAYICLWKWFIVQNSVYFLATEAFLMYSTNIKSSLFFYYVFSVKVWSLFYNKWDLLV